MTLRQELQIYSNDPSEMKYISRQVIPDATTILKTQAKVARLTKFANNASSKINSDPEQKEILDQVLAEPRGPVQSDDEFVRDFEATHPKPYRNQRDVPSGAEYDKDRDYIRAYNRIAKRPKQSTGPVSWADLVGKDTVKVVTFENACTLEVIDNEPIVTFVNACGIDVIEPVLSDEDFVEAMYSKITKLEKPKLAVLEWKRLRKIYLHIHDIRPDVVTLEQTGLKEEIKRIYGVRGKKLPSRDPKYVTESNLKAEIEAKKYKLAEESKKTSKQVLDLDFSILDMTEEEFVKKPVLIPMFTGEPPKISLPTFLPSMMCV